MSSEKLNNPVSWDDAIQDAKDQRDAGTRRVGDLDKAIADLIECKKRGDPWPTAKESRMNVSATQN